MSAAEVAKGLTRAQRRAVLLKDAKLEVAAELTGMGLVQDTQRYLVGWATVILTPLGLEVCRILQETPDAQ